MGLGRLLALMLLLTMLVLALSPAGAPAGVVVVIDVSRRGVSAVWVRSGLLLVSPHCLLLRFLLSGLRALVVVAAVGLGVADV